MARAPAGLRARPRAQALFRAAFVAALSSMTSPAPAESAPSPQKPAARLIFEGVTPRCPSADELASRVNQLMNREALVAGGENLRIYSSIERTDRGLVARLRLVTSDGHELGTRWLHSATSDCGELRERLALVLALMLDLPPESPPLRDTTERAAPLGIETALGATASIGWFPDPTFGFEASMRWDSRRLVPLSVGFTFWPPSRFSTGVSDYQLRAWTATLLVSPTLFERPWIRLSGGAGARVGQLSARGLDFPSNWSSSALVLDAEAELQLALRCLGPLWIRAAGGPLSPLVRPRVFFSDAARQEVETHRAAVVHSFFALSLAARF